MKIITTIYLLFLSVSLILFSGCKTGKVTDTSKNNPEKLIMGLAMHANPSEDSFWAVVEKGARDAGKTYKIEIRSGGNTDPAMQARLIEDYIAAGVKGIVVSLANPDALKDALLKAYAAGIPVISINSGLTSYKELKAITHVGQTEFIAGQGSGQKLNAASVKKVLCVLHEEGNIGLEQRYKGLADTFKGTIVRFNVSTTGVRDVSGTLASIQNKLLSDTSIDSIMALNPVVAMAALDAVQSINGNQKLATFDLSPDILSAIEEGKVLFAVDQQQYLQGYLPISFLYLYQNNLNTVGGGHPVLTGPGFVDKTNASLVKNLVGKGTR